MYRSIAFIALFVSLSSLAASPSGTPAAPKILLPENQTDCNVLGPAEIGGTVRIELRGNSAVDSYEILYNGFAAVGLPGGNVTFGDIVAFDDDITINAVGEDGMGNRAVDPVVCPIDFVPPTCAAAIQEPDSTSEPVTIRTVVRLTAVTENAVRAEIDGDSLRIVEGLRGISRVLAFDTVFRAEEDTIITATIFNAEGETAECTWNIDTIDRPPVVTPPAAVTVEATGPVTPVALGSATVEDDVDSLAATPDVTGPFPLGTTIVTWSATDRSGNTGMATQAVTVIDTTPPALTLLGDDPLTLEVGDSFTDPGATAADLVDGDLSAAIAVAGDVNESAAGSYTVSYTVSDAAGNDAEATRTVVVSLAEEAALSITKTDAFTAVEDGALVDYVITVSNAGPDDVVGASVMDVLPAGLTGASWICESATGASCSASGAGDIVDSVDLAAGTSVVYTLTATVDAADGTIIENTATVDASATARDPEPADNVATDETRVGELVFDDGFETSPGANPEAVLLAKQGRLPLLIHGADGVRIHLRWTGSELQERISQRSRDGRWLPGPWHPIAGSD